MTEKELRRLSRGDLLEILVEQGEKIEELETSLSEARKELEDRNIAIENAGSIAEASLLLNGVFSAAENASQQYLENIERLSSQQEQICSEREAESRETAERVLREAKEESERILKDAESRSRTYWDEVRTKMEQMIDASVELQRALRPGDDGGHAGA